jgi:predicted nucleotidyltransferase
VIDEQAIELAGSRLAAAAPRSARVYLFGSAARAETGPDSDLDFLVIETVVYDRAREAVRLRRAVGDVGVPLDVIVLDSATAPSSCRRMGRTLTGSRHGRLTSARYCRRDRL